MQIPSMPFKILALAPFMAASDTNAFKNPIAVDKAEFDQVMADLALSVYVTLPADLCPKGGIEIKINRMKDFHPDQMLKTCEYLKNLFDAKTFIEKSKSSGKSLKETGDQIRAWPDLPPITIETEAPPKKKKSSESSIDNILSMVALPDDPTDSPAQKSGMSKQIETILQKILQHIFSEKEFIRLESVFRGLQLFLKQIGTEGEVKLEILPVTAESLGDTLDNLIPSLIDDQPSLVIADFPFDNTPLNLESLEKLASFSETLMVPTICWVTRNFFYIDDWKDFKSLPFLPNHLTESHYAKWRKLEQSSFGRWLSVTCNCFLARYPYGSENKPRTIEFNENGKCWTAPVWALASLIGQSVIENGWPSRFTAYPQVVIEDLPLNTENPDKQIPTEVYFTKDRLDQFLRIGMMPLSCMQNKDIAFIRGDITVAGISLKYQMVLSSVTRLVFWCLDNFDKNAASSDIEASFSQAITMLWEKSGHKVPEDMVISAGTPDSERRIPLRITLTPPSDILPSGEKIELEFLW